MAVVQLDMINNHPPLIYKPWTIPLRPYNLNPSDSFPCGSIGPIHQEDLAHMTMDGTHLTPPDTRSDGAIESLPLLSNESGPRPYQAYCVTEASSRTPSPDALIPRPLRIRAFSEQECDSEPRCDPGDSSLQTPAPRTEQDYSLAMVPRQDDKSNEQQESSIQRPWSRNAMLQIQDHITQAVTPRGRHPLTDCQTMMYDQTPSHLRMQQTLPTYVAVSPAYRREPLPQDANNVGVDPHPLPPLPVDSAAALDLDSFQLEDNSSSKEDAEQSLRHSQAPPVADHDDQGEGRLPVINYSRKALQTPPELPRRSETFVEDYAKIPRPSVSFQTDPPLPSLHPPYNDVKSQAHDTPPAQNHTPNEPIQLPSSTSLYIPHSLFSDIHEDILAHRRTQPKDAKFKYQFGRRPSPRLSLPQATPLHKRLPKSTTPHSRLPFEHHDLTPTPCPPFHFPSYADGPRPPPWGSYDDLELKRQTRSDARERYDARKYRMHIDSRSLGSKGSSSSESLRGEEMKREVEEYRMQVLRLYPDMEFDGNAGKGGRGRGCCCCWGCLVM